MAGSSISVETIVKADPYKVWNCWTQAPHIMNWNFASEDWHCPKAVNDLRVGGKFSYTMAAKDGSMSFDFEGTYDEVQEPALISYTIADQRKVKISFEKTASGIRVVENFETENLNPVEMQRAGWQAILDNFKKYAETL